MLENIIADFKLILNKKSMDRELRFSKPDEILDIREGVSHNISHLLFLGRAKEKYSAEHLKNGIAALEELKKKATNKDNIMRIGNLLIKLNSIDANSPVDLSLLDDIGSSLDELSLHGWV